MSDNNDIQKLLRLKRFEQPPPQYFEKFLEEFQRRQRSELLRQPLWQIACDRFQAFFSEHSLPRFAYAGAMAAVLILAVITSVNILAPVPAGLVAQSDTPSRPVSSVQTPFGLDSRVRMPALADFSNQKARMATVSTAQPHYVIDARPVSYELSSSF